MPISALTVPAQHLLHPSSIEKADGGSLTTRIIIQKHDLDEICTPTRTKHIRSPVAYPELVSRGVSKSRKFKWLVRVGACKDVSPLI